MASVSRRQFIQTLGIGFGAVALGPLLQKNQTLAMPFQGSFQVAEAGAMSFKPIKAALPLVTDGLDLQTEAQTLAKFEVVDDVVLPEGFEYTVISAWGDDLGNGQRVGFNHDWTGFYATNRDATEGFLSINHEYIDSVAWLQSYQEVIGPNPVVAKALTAFKENQKAADIFSNEEMLVLAGEAMRDMGMSVQKVKLTSGKWQVVPSPETRAVTGLSGLGINKLGAKSYQGLSGDDKYLVASGPAARVFEQGWDGLGNRIIGTFANCSGGETPWGTSMTAEENFQSWVQEDVLKSGQSRLPSGEWDIAKASAQADIPAQQIVVLDSEDGVRNAGSAFKLQGNKYGWMVEIDPSDPKARPVKHTALGRFRHENITFRADEGQPLVAYMGDDRRGGHTWKFVSKGVYQAAAGKANSKLLEEGTLYAAQLQTPLNGKGKGVWIPLEMNTPVDPLKLLYLTKSGDRYTMRLPARVASGQKQDGGFWQPQTQAEMDEWKSKFKTLADLYENDGAIMIDAFLAANAVGATPTARPEDLEVHPKDKTVYIAYTDGRPGGDGSPHRFVFETQVKDVVVAAGGKEVTIGKAGPQPFGGVYRILEKDDKGTATEFRYEIFQTSGEVGAGGPGYANVDNLAFDPNGNLWLVTDQSTSGHNRAVRDRMKDPVNGVFGNNAVFFVPTSGPDAGKAFLFAFGPMECEMTGPTFTPDGQTLFISVQHPGEIHGARKGSRSETRSFEILSRDGKSTFKQERIVPMGSNWPSKQDGKAPKPAVIAIQKKAQGRA